MRMFLTIILIWTTVALLFAQGSNTDNTDSDTDSEFQMKFPSATIHHPGLSGFVFDKLIPIIRKENSPYGEVRIEIPFYRFPETSPISADLRVTSNRGLRPLGFARKAGCGRAYVCNGDSNVVILIEDVDSIAIKEGFIVRSEKDSLEVDKEIWKRIGTDDSIEFCYFFGFTIDRDSIYLDTYKHFGAGYPIAPNVGPLSNDDDINSILPKKSKSALEREERKKQKARCSPRDTLRLLEIPELDQLQKKQ